MQTVSWNYRGLGNQTKAEAVKDLLKMVPSDIILLQETNIEEEALLMLSKSKWNLNSVKAVNARATFGGLATLWRDDKFQLNHWFATQHWIFIDLFHISSNIPIALFNLYIHVSVAEKKRMLEVAFWVH